MELSPRRPQKALIDATVEGRTVVSARLGSRSELGFSEDAAYNRIAVARLIRRLPVVLEVYRSGTVHLTGLRLLSTHLTEENHMAVLEEAKGKSKRDIEELVARLAPRPSVPDAIRRLPAPTSPKTSIPEDTGTQALPLSEVALPKSSLAPRVPAATSAAGQRPSVTSLAEETFRVQFTASRALRDKLKTAQELLGHRVPSGDLASVVEKALDVLISEVKKRRFGVGRKPRASVPAAESAPAPAPVPASRFESASTAAPESASRHIPFAIRRAVYERDGGVCTFVDERGRRCNAGKNLEFDHIEGFARTRVHTVEGIRLRCRAHNQHAAEEMYGREFMDEARRRNALRPVRLVEWQPAASTG
jgi:hypothetical protein